MANDLDEFTNAYTGGWGKIPLQKSGGIRTFKVRGVIPLISKSGNVHIEIITSKKITKELTYSYEYVINNAIWYYPESKYVNTSNYAVRCVAYPNRQYKKTLTDTNAYFSAPTVGRLPPEIVPLLKQSILDILDNYDAPYPTYEVAYRTLCKGDALARAFAKRFLIALSPNAEFPILYYKGSAIGYDRGDLVVCIPKVENLHEAILNATQKAVIYHENR